MAFKTIAADLKSVGKKPAGKFQMGDENQFLKVSGESQGQKGFGK